MKKAYFQYYETFEDILAKIKDDVKREAFRRVIIRYGLYGTEPGGLTEIEDMAWGIIKDLIDQQLHRREVNRANRSGKKTKTVEQVVVEVAPVIKPVVKPQRMEKPTLEEIKSYCKEKGYAINSESFYSYYESNGWKIGGRTAMKNWKAAVQSWAAREKKNGTLWADNSSDAEVEEYAAMFK